MGENRGGIGYLQAKHQPPLERHSGWGIQNCRRDGGGT